jgi:hypothetical protein
MSPILIAGITIVNLALLSYGAGIISEQRSHRVTSRTLNLLRVGVVLDITATACMITGSSSGPFTLHGLLGFSSLTAMIIETALAWRHRARLGDELVPPGLHLYSRFAYGWWLVAYVTGAYLVMSGRG